MNTTLGTVERFTSMARDDLKDVIEDEDNNIVLRGTAAVAYAGHTALGWTAYLVKTPTDVLSGYFKI